MSLEARRILIPLDGSREAEEAVKAVLPLLRGRPTQALLLNVLEGVELPPWIRPYLEKIEAELESRGMAAEIHVRAGIPAAEIVAYAQEMKVDIIAMSTHGRSGLSRIRMGSVTEDVLRHTDAPILVCRPGTATATWHRMIVALDGSSRSEEILPDAAGLAQELGATLHLVKVGLPIVTPGGVGEFGVFFPPEDSMPYLRKLCVGLDTEGTTSRPVALTGRAPTEIVRYVRDVGAGLICMTTHGRTGLSRLLMGSITEEILRTAPCPVLVRRSLGAAKRVEATGSLLESAR